MLNKDKRSFVLSLVLGDGCLHYTSNKRSCALTIDHGVTQSDYQAWKAKLLSEIFEREVRLRQGHNGKSIQLSVCNRKLRSYRKWVYPGNKKDLSRILPFLRHPEMAVAIWFMDDGYAEPSFTKIKSGKKLYGARLRLFTCDQSIETQNIIIAWFKEHFDINLNIRFQKTKTKTYPFLKLGQADSLKLWKIIREFVLTFKSMQHKFRHLEHIYQHRLSQPLPGNT